MNPDLDKLKPYPFERLAKIKAEVTPPSDKAHIALSVGEPKHEPPSFVLDALKENIERIASYPTTAGTEELREAIKQWLCKRFHLPEKSLLSNSSILPVNGTREALFAFAQAIVDRSKNNAAVLTPNPFYQIYEGAAYLAGAEPVFLNCLKENNFIPDYNAIDAATWDRCQLLYLCTPGNPNGATHNKEQLQNLIRLAIKHDFIIASDECYSEIYIKDTPCGLLEAANDMGNDSYQNCVVFHSLSKRSNLPGLRSGFVAGDAKILKKFLRYRTYHGCTMAIPNQIASIAAWGDENHVSQNRQFYKTKFEQCHAMLKAHYPIEYPDAGFYFWLNTPINDIDFAQKLFAGENVTVLPGQFLSRTVNGINPGENYVRMAMVATIEECEEAAKRLINFRKNLA